jgi:hypothetical protein
MCHLLIINSQFKSIFNHKKDELNAENVKNGFKYIIPDLLKEYEVKIEEK